MSQFEKHKRKKINACHFSSSASAMLPFPKSNSTTTFLTFNDVFTYKEKCFGLALHFSALLLSYCFIAFIFSGFAMFHSRHIFLNDWFKENTIFLCQIFLHS